MKTLLALFLFAIPAHAAGPGVNQALVCRSSCTSPDGGVVFMTPAVVEGYNEQMRNALERIRELELENAKLNAKLGCA